MAAINANEFDGLLGEIQKYLGFLKKTGCPGIELGPKSIDIINSWKIPLSQVYNDYLGCTRCGLARNRKVSVFGAGPRNAQLMFVGFFPEQEDEKTGQPFTGTEGALLNRIIKAMKLERESVYICHAVKCRPAGETSPGRREAKACRHHLIGQIEAIQPEIICVLGESAAGILLGEDVSMNLIRGRLHHFKDISVMPTFDPAYLLAHPLAKRPVWEDMQKVMQMLSL